MHTWFLCTSLRNIIFVWKGYMDLGWKMMEWKWLITGQRCAFTERASEGHKVVKLGIGNLVCSMKMLLPISMPENRQLLWHRNLLSWNWIVMAVLLFCLSPAVSVQNNLCLECAETTNPFCYFYAIRISIVATITLFCNSCRSRVQLPLMRLCGEE